MGKCGVNSRGGEAIIGRFFGRRRKFGYIGQGGGRALDFFVDGLQKAG